MEGGISKLGQVVFLGLTHLFSTNRRAIRWHTVLRGLAPSRQHDLARLGGRALTAGALANFGSACIASVLL